MGAASTEKLIDAKENRTLVRFRRRYEDFDICGYVVDIGPKFFLLQLVSDRIRFDGFECFRIRDISKLKPDPHSSFIETALALRFPEGVDSPVIDLNSIETLLTTAAANFPVLTLHCEGLSPDASWIGKFLGVRKSKALMRLVTPSAEWDDEIFKYPLKSITRVGFGADYEAALHLVAGDPVIPQDASA